MNIKKHQGKALDLYQELFRLKALFHLLQNHPLPGEKLKFILEQDEFYCDLCMFETQDEKRLANHFVMTHYNEVYGR